MRRESFIGYLSISFYDLSQEKTDTAQQEKQGWIRHGEVIKTIQEDIDLTSKLYGGTNMKKHISIALGIALTAASLSAAPVLADDMW
jgi:hypothetical protein